MRIQLQFSVGPILLLTIASQLAAVSIQQAAPPNNLDLEATKAVDRMAGPKFVSLGAPESELKAAAATMMMGNELGSFAENQDVDDDDEDEDEDEDEDDDEDEDEDDDEDEDYDQEEDEDEDQEAEGYDDDEDEDDYDEDQEGLDEATSSDYTCSIRSSNPDLRRRYQVSRSSIMARQSASTDDTVMNAEATAEPGGACIDSVVNFSLRFRERCTITCLKTLTHVFVNPNVLGLLDCFGCSNFLVSGIYAIGQDCIGIFTSPVKGTKVAEPTETKVPTPTVSGATPTPSGGKAAMGDQTRFDAKTTHPTDNTATHPYDAGLPAFDLNSLIGNLVNINMSDVQSWLDIGTNVAQLVQGGQNPATEVTEDATSPAFTTPSGSFTLKDAETVEGSGQSKVQQGPVVSMDKDTFNKYILKAASFANWKLTPEMLEKSGAYDRAQLAGFV